MQFGQACDRAKNPEAIRAIRKDAAGAILYPLKKQPGWRVKQFKF